MNDWKRVSLAAVFLIVVLRIAIGWQFLYEGIWKYETLQSPTPWTAEGYLKAAQGPFRDTFRNMTGDPDDLGWLDFDSVSARWDEWAGRFAAHYGLDEAQQKALHELVTGPPSYEVRLDAMPAGLDLTQLLKDKLKGGPTLTYDATRKALILDAATPLKPVETAALLDAVPITKTPDGQYVTKGDASAAPVPADLAYYKAIERLERESAKLSFKQRLAAALRGDPELLGVTARSEAATPERYVPEMGTVLGDNSSEEVLKYGEVQVYKDMLADYERQLGQARGDSIDFRQQHMEVLWNKIQAKRSELTGPIKALDKSLKEDAVKLLTPEQLAKGPPPRDPSPVTRASNMAMYSLLILGVLLIAGLCTRLAAVAGALMVLSFYLVVPPWPGVPQPPSPEHSFLVNKNLIEVFALLMIAALPSGSWFGLDAFFRRLFCGCRKPST